MERPQHYRCVAWKCFIPSEVMGQGIKARGVWQRSGGLENSKNSHRDGCIFRPERGKIIIIIIHSFYIALFSALEQTHCAHVACDSE